MQQVLDLFANWKVILPFLLAFNVLLQGIHSALGALADAMPSSKNADSVVVKVISFIQGLLDLLMGNKEH